MKNKDLFLMIPCDLTNYEIQEKNNEIGKFLIEQVAENNKSEFRSDFIKCLERHVIGNYKLKSPIMEKEEDAIFTITIHPQTKNGLIIMYISLAINETSKIIQSLIAGLLNVQLKDNKYKKLDDFLIERNIITLGTPRALVFIDGEIEKREIINILACEANPMGEIKGEKLVQMSSKNIAQYNSAKVYCSENVLLELQNVFLLDIKERLKNEAIEVFFLELLLLQDSAISRLCNKIIKEINIETTDPTRENNISVLDELSCEVAQAILFLDFNCFIYPTVRNAVEEIAESFGLQKLKEKYYKYKEVLETLISIHMNRVDDMKNNNMNILLLVLTLTQIIPILIELFNAIYYREINFITILMFMCSIASCFIILAVFNLLKKYKLNKYKRSMLRRK